MGRMVDDRLPKRAAELHEQGRRRRGRQMLRWEDRDNGGESVSCLLRGNNFLVYAFRRRVLNYHLCYNAETDTDAKRKPE